MARRDLLRIGRCKFDPPYAEVDSIRVVHAGIAIAQLAEENSIETAVVAGDYALHGGLLTKRDMAAACTFMRRLHKSQRMSDAVALMDSASESPGESLLRIIATRAEIALESQFEIRDQRGRFVARCDFRCAGTRVIIEFDGKVKYDDRDALFAEKRREDAIRALGWTVVRVTWAELLDPPTLVAKLRKAIGAREHDRGAAARR